MEPLSIVNIGMALLQPLLTKATEKAAETIGEKLAEKSVESTTWQKIKGLFVEEEEKQVVNAIENKPVATQHEVAIIEAKVNQAVTTNPQFATELKTALNITPLNEFLVTEKANSIKRLQAEIARLQLQMERAGIGTEGDYINKIELQQEKLEYQISELIKILHK